MRRVLVFGTRIWDYFKNMNLLRKLTLAYTVAILIPTIAIGSYTYYQSISYIKKEMAQNANLSLMQMSSDIERKTSIIRGISNNIAFNYNVQNLLYYGLDFVPEALNEYIDSETALIKYALNFSEASIYRLGVYYVNESIPEKGIFLKEKRVHDSEWYDEFIKSDDNELWLYPAKAGRYSSSDLASGETVVKMVKKIVSVDRKYLGMVIIDILASDMFSSLDFDYPHPKTYVIDSKNRITYPLNVNDQLSVTKTLGRFIEDSDGYFINENILYNYLSIEPLNAKIVLSTEIRDNIRNSSLAVAYNMAAVIIGVIVLIIFTYFLLKIIFSRLNQIVKVMGIVAKGNFNIRIPVYHTDEIGQLAEDFNILINKINVLIKDSIIKETAQKNAQLNALQYQINPHFIYNTIDIFRMQLELEGNYQMADAITYFGRMLRYNINPDSKHATIKEEVEYIKKYIILQKLRYGDALILEVNLPEELEKEKIIRFTLQPIVENSIKHGFKNSSENLTINLSFFKTANRIEIHISDNGNGLNHEYLDRMNQRLRDANEIDEPAEGLGILNINQRLKLFYGEQYHLRMESIKGEYTRTIITIPYDLEQG